MTGRADLTRKSEDYQREEVEEDWKEEAADQNEGMIGYRSEKVHVNKYGYCALKKYI